jgi:hypothetical protein
MCIKLQFASYQEKGLIMKFKQYIKESHMDDFGDSLLPIGDGLYRYANGDNVNIISEASLTRLLRHYEDGSFAIITAYRDEYSKEEKIRKNRELRGILNSMKMGVHQLVGHWQECQLKDVDYEDCPKNKLKDVVERSYFVPKRTDMTDKEFEKIIHGIVKKFEQDAAVLYVDGTAYILPKSGSKIKIGTKLSLNKIAQGYSQHVKKMNVPFTFEGVEQPGSNSGKMIMNACGIKWVVEYASTLYITV